MLLVQYTLTVGDNSAIRRAQMVSNLHNRVTLDGILRVVIPVTHAYFMPFSV